MNILLEIRTCRNILLEWGVVDQGDSYKYVGDIKESSDETVTFHFMEHSTKAKNKNKNV